LDKSSVEFGFQKSTQTCFPKKKPKHALKFEKYFLPRPVLQVMEFYCFYEFDCDGAEIHMATSSVGKLANTKKSGLKSCRSK